MNEGEAFIREAARVRGIDPDIAVRVAMSEGGTMPPGNVGKFNTGWSYWQLQLHYAMEGKPGVTNPTVGMGEGFTALTGWEPGDPAAWRDSVRYALNRVKAGGWGPWYGAAAVGVGTWDGIDRNHPWDANAEVWDFERATPPPPAGLTYNPDTPPERQIQDWVCAIRTATWVLRSVGVSVDAGTMQDRMVPRFVRPDVGLLDARGYGLRDALAELLPPGTTTEVLPAATWEDIAARAGKGPIALGGRSLYHWVAVRRQLPDGTLSLMNPAPAWQGIKDDLTREEWDRWGPWSAVYVPVTTSQPVPVTTLEQLRTLVGVAYHAEGAVRTGLEAAIRPHLNGEQIREQVQAVLNFLRDNNPDKGR